jgi:hypothetical protein
LGQAQRLHDVRKRVGNGRHFDRVVDTARYHLRFTFDSGICRTLDLAFGIQAALIQITTPPSLTSAQITPFAATKRANVCSVPEIFEIRRDTEVATTHELNDGLQVVFLFSGDANLPVLQLALDFEPLGFDRLNNFFGFVPFEALLDLQFLPCVADG